MADVVQGFGQYGYQGDGPTGIERRGPAAGELPSVASMKPSDLDDASALRVFKAWFKGDARHSKNWREKAREDFGFVAGDQWSVEDQGYLKAQKRTPITFNRTLTIIKAVAGMEINGRHEIAYLPRKLEDAEIDETLTGACKWMSDECDGEDEESEAFQHSSICGMGWAEHWMDYEEEAQGKYLEGAVDPLEMYWDRTARKKNLVDARRIMRVKVLPLYDAMQMFEGKNRNQLNAAWAYQNEVPTPEKTLEERRIRNENSSGPLDDQDEVTLVQAQWWEREECWCVADEQNQRILQIGDEVYQKLKARHDQVQQMMSMAMPGYQPKQLKATRGRRKVYKQAFIGGEILELGAAPWPEGFTFTCITGELHHIERTWYGIVRTLRDPQMWGNKWLSQVLHILNSTAKGGILAEEDAFADIKQAEEQWAQPGGIVWANKNALSGQKSKIQEKPGSANQGTMSGYMELLTLAINATRDVSGINLELLGQKDINQPGILEAMRKQAGMTVLATMFDSLRRMRKIVGRIRLYFIQNFLSDGRIIRITGQDGAKSVRLLRDKTLGEYSVVVADTPTSPNMKEQNWAIISQLLPAFKDQLMARPDVLMTILDYSPLPQRLIASIKQTMQNPQSDPTQQQLQQLAIAEKTANISKTQAQAELFLSQAKSTESTALYDIAMARNLLLKHQGDAVKAIQEAHANGLKARNDAMLAAANADHTTAKADETREKIRQLRARTPHDLAQARADTHNTVADTISKFAGMGNDQANTRIAAHKSAHDVNQGYIGNLIDLLSAQQPEEEGAEA